MIRLFLIIFAVNAFLVENYARTIWDSPDNKDVLKLFQENGGKYVLRFPHQFVDTLVVPYGCEIFFAGGSLSGPIVFNDTKLKGKVDLKGSSIRGTIRNKFFNALWLCAIDGVTDDAPRINEMIEVCGNVFFPKGNYRLLSAFNPEGKLPKELHSAVDGHIAICKSHVSLEGEAGTVFITDRPLVTLCIFSQLNDIEHSISKIKIENITFEVHNDGKTFYEFMHTIKMMGVNGITIKNCMFNDFWGDAICLSHFGDDPHTGERSRNQGVDIENNTILGGLHHNNRNGISVVNGKNVIIKGNIIKNTSRKDMPGGIDVEPNNSAYTIDNIKVVKNTLEGCRGNCGAIEVCMFNNGPGHNISIEDNYIRDCNRGIYVYLETNCTTDNFTIKNNYVAEDTPPYEFVGNGISKNWIVEGNTFEYPCCQKIPGKIRVYNLIQKNNKKKE